jgi:sterol desaturase/sphingolipid hydroxylase (fatty acid hydroxylase superfamily)
MVNAGNDPGMRASLTNMVSFKGHQQQNVNILNYNSQKPKQLLYYPNDNQLQDEQTAPQKKETSRGLKSFYTVLAVLAALALGFLVAAAACGLSCNGMVGLAFLVGIGGGGLVIAFAVWLIKSIWHPKHKKRIKPSEGTDSIPQEGALQT